MGRRSWLRIGAWLWLWAVTFVACNKRATEERVTARTAGDNNDEEVIAKLTAAGFEIVRDDQAPGRPAVKVSISGPVARLLAERLPLLRQLKMLREVKLSSGIRGFNGDDVLDSLMDFPNLQVLSLVHTAVSDAGLKQLERFPSLRVLRLSCCFNVTDKGIKHLKRLRRLQVFELYTMPKITDAGLEGLAELRELRELELFGAGITDRGVAILARLPALEDLCLINCWDLTDGCLKSLRAAPKLRRLTLPKEISDEAIKAYKRDKPGVRVNE